jgi:3-oxoacyl-[acyl-carrier protein] reductase
MRLKDRVALVTGAQQGIGAAIARAYGREGASVVVNYLDDTKAAEAIVAEIRDAGGRAVAVPGDVARAGDVATMIAAAEPFGGVDLLVNNAGIFPRVEFLDMTEDHWDQVLDVNLKGAFLCARAAAAAMVARGAGGAILNITSRTAHVGAALGVHYGASKAGLIGLTGSMALALAPHRIRVNAIAPGLTDTAQPRDGMTEAEIDAAAAAIPLGRITRAEEVADAAVFLATDESRQITGQTLHVNGGQLLT